MDEVKKHQLIILGAGPAGTAAGVYAARKKIDTLIITENFGGQAVVAAKIENIVGFEEISGIEMARRFEKQLRHYTELEIIIDRVNGVVFKEGIFEIKTDHGTFYGERILATLGRHYRQLGVPKEKELEGKGVFYCSTCDAPLMRNKRVAVIGGGNSALLSVIDLIPFASQIYLLTNESDLRCDPVLIDRIKHDPKIEIHYNVEIKSIEGDKMVSGLKYKEGNDLREHSLAVSGIFIQAGMQPNSELFKNLLKMNEAEEIIVEPLSGRTSHRKVWAAGDITNLPYKQISVAIGDGVRALLDIYNEIRNTELKEFI
ncbi:MAG: FAD-dependent oxidoreductase [Candidatus Paceibacterota bacterium]|nr:FAD-dependent oxidoreductase [Candidatus Paceibacterota bacterium]HQM34821.1 FAD-dependent oxidoreductase [Candidatus Paceibacterota bacterium]